MDSGISRGARVKQGDIVRHRLYRDIGMPGLLLTWWEYPGDEDYIDAYQDFYGQFIDQDDEIAEEEPEKLALTEN